jgi:Dolichyl-phosphate-mannose-protein mannosyltransferase
MGRIEQWPWRKIWIAAAVTAIATFSALARLVDLSGQPGGLYPDEAAEGITAHQILTQPGYHPFFDPADGGRETLFAYLVAFGFRLFGESTATLRGTSAVLGVLAVLAMGLAVRRFGTAVALVAMAWAAGSLWLIAVSRDGMRNIICVFVGALALAALLNWYDRPRRRSAWLAGAFVGLGLWTYQPLKFTPFLCAIWLYLLWRYDRDKARALLKNIRGAAAVFLIVAAPMLWTAVTNPSAYFGRGLATSVFNTENGGGESLLTHTLRTLGQFLFTGDPNARHDVNALPLLGAPLLALMVLGLVVCWRRRRGGIYSLLLLGLPVYLIPPLVATEGGSPHFLRNLGLAPYLAAYIGLGGGALVSWARKSAGAGTERVMAAGLAFCLALLAAAGAEAYFSRPSADLYTPYSYDLVTMARLTDGGAGDVVVLDSYSAMDIEFLDDGNLPTIVSPGTHLSRPGAYSVIVARSRKDIAGVAGGDIAARAVVAGEAPNGTPTVWAAVP